MIYFGTNARRYCCCMYGLQLLLNDDPHRVTHGGITTAVHGRPANAYKRIDRCLKCVYSLLYFRPVLKSVYVSYPFRLT